MRFRPLPVLSCLLCLATSLLTTPTLAAEPPGALIDQLWRADTKAERAPLMRELQAAAPDVQTLYGWLRQGPTFAADVPRGEQLLERSGSDAQVYPYLLLVPEDYDPARAWPVEFNLHGGVNRPKSSEGVWWRRNHASFADPGRIVVVPAAWEDAYWWFSNQAENLPEILRSIKQDYNIDENRVTMSGVSDGGTGAYFFALFQPTPWAAFMPYIGNPGVLRNPNGRVSYPLYYENLRGKPLYIVTGENDPLYPADAIRPHIEAMRAASVPHTWVVIPGGGHNTEWMPEQASQINAFREKNVRDPLPDTLNWTSVRIDRYNRNHWIRIDERSLRGEPARMNVARSGNTIDIEATGVAAFTLLLNPEEIDFGKALIVRANGTEIHASPVEQDAEVLLEWAAEDLDREMLFTAELPLRIPDSAQTPAAE